MRYYSFLRGAGLALATVAGLSATAFAAEDTTPPTAALTSPLQGATVKSITGVFGTASDNVGVVSARLYLARKFDSKYWNGHEWTAIKTFVPMNISNGKISYSEGFPAVGDNPATQLIQTRYSAVAYVYDSAGNSFGTVPNIFDIDRTAPTATITMPGSEEQVKTITSIRGTARDNEGGVGIYAVKFAIRRKSDSLSWNGSAWVEGLPLLLTQLTSTGWISTSPLPAGDNLGAGRYYLYAYAYDKAGNRNAEPARSDFIVDKSAPVVKITNPLHLSYIKGVTALSATATDNSGIISRVHFTLRRDSDGKSWNGTEWVTGGVALPATKDGSTFRYTALPLPGSNTATQLQNGLYVAKAYAFDAAGNQTISESSAFTIDSVLPAGAVTAPANGATGLTALTRVAGTATDTGSGIGRVLITISRPTTTGGLEVWARRSGVFGWGTTEGDLPVATVASIGSRNTTWAAETNLPSGTNLRAGQHYVAAAIYDRANNRFVTDVNSFTIGAAAADSVKVGAPANGATVTALTAIEGRAIDAQGVAKVLIALSRRTSTGTVEVWGNRDGVFGWGTTQPLPLPATLTAPNTTDTTFRRAESLPSGSNLAPGAYFVAAQMFDAQNNSITSAVNSFTVAAAANAYAGKYNVSYVTNDNAGASDSGTFVVTVATNGAASGVIESAVFGRVTLSGSVNSSGVITATLSADSDANGDTFSGDLDSVSTVAPRKGNGTIRDTGLNDDGQGGGEITVTWTSTKQ